MRWVWICGVLACGSSERSERDNRAAPTMQPVSMQAASMESTMAATTMESEVVPASAMTEVTMAAEPAEVPEALRESHDRLVERIEANINDVPSICALASVLRRAEMYAAADTRLDDAFRISEEHIELELPEGTLEACHYERGRVAEAQEDWLSAQNSYWEAMATPIERRRRIVLEAFFRAAKAEVGDNCDGASTLGLRSLLSLKDDPVFRRCLREREQIEPTCPILRLDDVSYPGLREDNFDAYATVGDEGAAFGVIGDELYVISVIRGRKQVRQCSFDVPEDSRLSFPRVLTLGETTLFYVSTTNVISYACDCEEEEDGNCRCEDAFDIRFVFTDRGELRLALIDEYSEPDGMANVTWDMPHIRESIMGGPSVEGEVLRLGRNLRLRSHALVPAN